MRMFPIRRSLHRPALVLGGERDLVLYSGLLALVVGIGGFTLTSAITGAVFWLAMLFILRQMAKKDPQLSAVWRRHNKQQEFYPARGSIWQTHGWRG